MALVVGTNCGLVTSAPTADPGGDGNRTMDGYRRGIQIVVTETITITEIGWWCDTASEESNFEVGIYADSSNLPTDRLYVDNTNAKGTGAGWKVVSGLNWQLTAGTYWIAFQLDDVATTTSTDYGAATGEIYCYTSGATDLPDPFGSTSTFADQILAIYGLYTTAAGGNYNQASFRGYEDDAGEGSATPKAAVNGNWNQKQDENFRVRFLVQEEDDVEDLDVSFQLQYNLNSGGWNDVDGSSSVVRSFSSSYITDGANTTQQIGSGTFVTPNAGFDEVDGEVGGSSLDFSTTVNQEVELEFCIQIRDADTSRGDTVQLRLWNSKADAALTTYTNTPSLTIPTGAGMQMATAELLQSSAGAENPGTFNFDRSLPWGAITLALRRASGGQNVFEPTSKFTTIKTTGAVNNTDTTNINNWVIDADLNLEVVINLTGVTVTGAVDFATAGTYTFTNCIIDEVTNSSGGSVTINAVNCTITTNTGPNITINNSVPISIHVQDLEGGDIVGARVYLEAGAGGPLSEGTEIINDVTDSNGDVDDTFNFTSNQPVVGRVRKSTTPPLYKTFPLSGTITQNGFTATAIMVEDE